MSPTDNNNNTNNNNNNNDSSNSNSNNGKPLTDEWREWLRMNQARGCHDDVLIEECVVRQGFSKQQVEEELNKNKIKRNNNKNNNNNNNNNNDNNPSSTSTSTTTTTKWVTNSWKEWIKIQLENCTDDNNNEQQQKQQSNTSQQERQLVVLETLFRRLVLQEELDIDQVSSALGGYRSRNISSLLYLPSSSLSSQYQYAPSELYRLPFQKRTFIPRAWKVDSELVEMYEIPNFLSPKECQTVIEYMNSVEGNMNRSVVSYGDAESRTSRTCHLHYNPPHNNDNNNNNNNDIVHVIETKLQRLMGMNNNNNNIDDATSVPIFGQEVLQGQCYGPGEFFQPHTDWFKPNTPEYEKYCIPGNDNGTAGTGGGQRTWTVMIYLNTLLPEYALSSTSSSISNNHGNDSNDNGNTTTTTTTTGSSSLDIGIGGTTRFEHLNGREFIPIQGTALVWNNLDADGVTPNPWTLHEAKPVLRGMKYVLTKWYRQRPINHS